MKKGGIIVGVMVSLFVFLFVFVMLSVFVSNIKAEKLCSSFEVGTEKEELLNSLAKTKYRVFDMTWDDDPVILVMVAWGGSPVAASCHLNIESDKLSSAKYYDAD